MKLQIAFDIDNLEKCIKIAQQIEPFCDQFEIGSLLLCKYGIQAIQEFRKAFPDKEIIAETHIVDKGKDITNLCIDAGADWVTVMAGAQKQVIHSVCATAGSKKSVMLDLSDTTMTGQASMEAQALGVDAILFYKPAKDAESVVALDQWEIVRGNTKLPIYIASHIDRNSVQRVLLLKPDGIIISNAITEHSDPATEAQYFYKLINPSSKK